MKTAIQKDAEGNVIETGTKSDEEVLAEGGTVETVEEGADDVDELDADKPVSERDQVMAGIAEKRRLQNAGEPTDQDDPDANDDDLDTGDDADPDLSEVMVDLKVNGENIQRSQAEVDAAGGVAAIQKSISGELKLQQAAKERKDLDRDREKVQQVIGENTQLKNEIAELRTATAQKVAAGKETASKEEIAAQAKSIAGKFFNGDVDELETAIAEMLTAGTVQAPVAAAQAAPVVDEAAISRRVAAQLTFETERKEAVALFESDHADLNTPGRRDVVDRLTNDIMKENPSLGPKKVIAEAVTRARDTLGLPAPSAAPKNDLKAKKERKRATTDDIPVASQRGKPPVAGSQPKTKQQIFDEIEAGRSH